MEIDMTDFERRKQFLHEKLIGKTVRVEPLGDHYPEYDVCLFTVDNPNETRESSPRPVL